MSKKEQFEEEKAGKHYTVDSRTIEPLERAGGNLRSDYGDIKELAKSIRENGVRVPLQAYRNPDKPDRWVAIDGHRRLAACKLIHDEDGTVVSVKIMLVDARKITDEQLVIDMITTNSGKPLTPIELCEAVRRLKNYGMKIKDIATKFGKGQDFVRNLDLLATAPIKIRTLLADKKINYTQVLDILKATPDFDTALAAIEKAIAVAGADDKAVAKAKTAGGAIKITKAHVDEAINRCDSARELRLVFEKESNQDREIKDVNMYSVLKNIAENKFTAKDIEKLIYEKQ